MVYLCRAQERDGARGGTVAKDRPASGPLGAEPRVYSPGPGSHVVLQPGKDGRVEPARMDLGGQQAAHRRRDGVSGDIPVSPVAGGEEDCAAVQAELPRVMWLSAGLGQHVDQRSRGVIGVVPMA